MSHVAAADAGRTAFNSGNYPEAITHLNKALADNPKQPKWLVTLAEAYLKTKPEQPALALDAAEKAYVAASLRGIRHLMIQAMHFRATSSYRLGRLANAERCCRWVLDLACGKPAVDRSEAVDVDEQGRVKVPDFDPLAKPPFKQEYQKDGARMVFFRSRVVSALKEMMEKEPENRSLWPDAVKMPEVDFEGAQGKGKEIDNTDHVVVVENDSDLEEEGKAVPEIKSGEQVVEDLGAEIVAFLKSHQGADQADFINTWIGFYRRTQKEVETNPAALKLLEEENDKFLMTHPPKTDSFAQDNKITISVYAKGSDQHLAGSDLPVEVQATPSVVTVFNLPGWGKAGVAVKIKATPRIQPYRTKVLITMPRVEITLFKDSPEKWHYEVGTVKAGEVDQNRDAWAWIPTPSKPRQPSEHPDPRSVDLNTTIPLDDEPETLPSTSPTVTTAAPAPSAQAKGKAPSYPTSSRTGPKDWSKIAADEDDDDKDSGNPDAFFKMLYKNATPDQQRAMMKSFTESNGTALSTDWNDVSKRTIPTEPPQGVEERKWEL